MKITYWSDYACPYCFIAEARLHRAIEELGVRDEVEMEPRAFELNPEAPSDVESDTPTRFAKKYRMSLEDARAQVEHISQLGREIGLDFRYATTQYTNTFNAHRLMKLALSKHDRQIAEKTNLLLFEAYFTKNLRLSDESTLLEVAREAGLEEREARVMLDSDHFAEEVRGDEREAMRMNIHGVPYFVFPGGITIPGAISVEDFKSVLRQASVAPDFKAAQCGPDGCRI